MALKTTFGLRIVTNAGFNALEKVRRSDCRNQAENDKIS